MIARLLQAPTPGRLQCVCGSRITITVIDGARLKGNRVCGGKVVHKLICGRCYQAGKVSFMQAEPAST